VGEAATELDRTDLIDEIRMALAGDRPVVTIVGEPGIGKTTVLNAALEDVPVDWAWQVQCFEAEAELGLAVLAGFFEAVPDEIVDALPPPQRHAVDVVLYQASADGPGAVTDRLLGATTLSLIRGLLERGSVRLAIDDLHWCDPTSLAALHFALVRISDAGLCAVTSARSGRARTSRSRRFSVLILSAQRQLADLSVQLPPRHGQRASMRSSSRAAGTPSLRLNWPARWCTTSRTTFRHPCGQH
jgi:hypothetical protein